MFYFGLNWFFRYTEQWTWLTYLSSQPLSCPRPLKSQVTHTWSISRASQHTPKFPATSRGVFSNQLLICRHDWCLRIPRWDAEWDMKSQEKWHGQNDPPGGGLTTSVVDVGWGKLHHRGITLANFSTQFQGPDTASTSDPWPCSLAAIFLGFLCSGKAGVLGQSPRTYFAGSCPRGLIPLLSSVCYKPPTPGSRSYSRLCKVLEEKQMAGKDHRPRKAVYRSEGSWVGQHRLIMRVLGTWNNHLAKKDTGDLALVTQTGARVMCLSYF